MNKRTPIQNIFKQPQQQPQQSFFKPGPQQQPQTNTEQCKLIHDHVKQCGLCSKVNGYEKLTFFLLGVVAVVVIVWVRGYLRD